MDFDMALRLYMDAFRPPGEGQKIDRIMQVRSWVQGGAGPQHGAYAWVCVGQSTS